MGNRETMENNKTLKISIITPIYNCEEYLNEYLLSVHRQTLTEFEVICVNDGSSDHSANVIMDFSKRDTRFRIIDTIHENAGAARNKGIECATGEYLVFLDADDFFEEVLLQEAYETAKQTDADIVFFNGDRYNMETQQHEQVGRFLNKEFIGDKRVFSKSDIPDEIFCISNPAPWTKIYKREFIIKNELRFQSLKNTNDLYFTMMATALAEKISYVDSNLVHYRIGMKSNLQALRKEDPLCFLIALHAVYDGLTDQQANDRLMKGFLKQAVLVIDYNLKTDDSRAKRQIYKALSEDSPFFEAWERQHSILDMDRLSRTNKKLEYEVKNLRDQLKTIQNSKSFKLGKWLTWIPRELRAFFKRSS